MEDRSRSFAEAAVSLDARLDFGNETTAKRHWRAYSWSTPVGIAVEGAPEAGLGSMVKFAGFESLDSVGL